MPTRLTLRQRQLEDLVLLRDIGSEALAAINETVSELPGPPLRPQELRDAIRRVLTDRERDVDRITSQLLSLFALRRHRRLSAQEVLDGLLYGIERIRDPKARWSEEEQARWESIQPQLLELLSQENIWTVAKAVDLSYDYANLFQGGRIVTDIRPIFDAAASKMKGAVVSFTFRLDYDNPEGNHNLSIAMDESDVRILGVECERALSKARAAQEGMTKGQQLRTIIAGADDNGSL